MVNEHVLVDVSDGVATVTFNRPAKLNALSDAVMAELDDVVTELATRSDIRGAILTGSQPLWTHGCQPGHARGHEGVPREARAPV